MSVTTPQFTGPASGPRMGPTPTVFGTWQPGSTVYLFYNSDPNNVIGQALVDCNGNWSAGIQLRHTGEGNANVIAAKAVYGLENSGWARDLVLYP